MVMGGGGGEASSRLENDEGLSLAVLAVLVDLVDLVVFDESAKMYAIVVRGSIWPLSNPHKSGWGGRGRRLSDGEFEGAKAWSWDLTGHGRWGARVRQ